MPSDAKILIVDDHEETLYALESALAPLGYRPRRATSGDDALKEVLRGQVGLLLLDVHMPDANGFDVRYLRRLEQTQHIPVILVTGFGPDGRTHHHRFPARRRRPGEETHRPLDPAHQGALSVRRPPALSADETGGTRTPVAGKGVNASEPDPRARPRLDTHVPPQRPILRKHDQTA